MSNWWLNTCNWCRVLTLFGHRIYAFRLLAVSISLLIWWFWNSIVGGLRITLFSLQILLSLLPWFKLHVFWQLKQSRPGLIAILVFIICHLLLLHHSLNHSMNLGILLQLRRVLHSFMGRLANLLDLIVPYFLHSRKSRAIHWLQDDDRRLAMVVTFVQVNAQCLHAFILVMITHVIANAQNVLVPWLNIRFEIGRYLRRWHERLVLWIVLVERSLLHGAVGVVVGIDVLFQHRVPVPLVPQLARAASLWEGMLWHLWVEATVVVGFGIDA